MTPTERLARAIAQHDKVNDIQREIQRLLQRLRHDATVELADARDEVMRSELPRELVGRR